MERTAAYARPRASTTPTPIAVTARTLPPEVTTAGDLPLLPALEEEKQRFVLKRLRGLLPEGVAQVALPASWNCAFVPAWNKETPGTHRARSKPEMTWPEE
jgi:hypothetical protein